MVLHPIGHDFETNLLTDLLWSHVRPSLEILYSPAGYADKIKVGMQLAQPFTTPPPTIIRRGKGVQSNACSISL
jgi:hypothetical protein